MQNNRRRAERELHEFRRTRDSQRDVELKRRQAAGLIFHSPRDDRLTDYEQQYEFIQWMQETFGYASDPVWCCKSTTKGVKYNTWLLKEPQHVLMAKLRWG